MYDNDLFLRTLSEFSATVLSPYDVDAVLKDLMERVTELLGLDGSGVALPREGRLEFMTAVPARLAELERVQIEHQAGPCVEAFHKDTAVAVADLRTQQDRWPEYCAVAERQGMISVAGIPMRLAGSAFGALNLYGAGPRAWPEEDLTVAGVMADLATGYLISVSKLRQQEQLNEQLQRALDSKAIIEQAKGIVANQRHISVDEGFAHLRAHARQHNVTIRSLAEAIVHLGVRI